MIFRKENVEGGVFHHSQKQIRPVLPARHAALDGAAAEHARSENRIGLSTQQGADQLGNDLRIVLMIGMDHHHDLAGHFIHRCSIAGLLIAAVAAIPFMDNHAHRKLAGQLDRPVAGAVIDQQDLVDPSAGDVVVCGAERSFRVVCRQHGDDFLFVQRHGLGARVTHRVGAAIPVTIRTA